MLQGLLPSILDRLIDPDSMGTAARRGYSVEQMGKAVQADLERLFNTHSNDSVSASRYRLLSQVLGYGLPDLTTLTRLSTKDTEVICRMMEKKILQYEPRLKNVRVSRISTNDDDPLRIQLQMRAVLAMEPAPDMSFVTILDLSTGRFTRGGQK